MSDLDELRRFGEAVDRISERVLKEILVPVPLSDRAWSDGRRSGLRTAYNIMREELAQVGVSLPVLLRG
jgi:hypothetical protein